MACNRDIFTFTFLLNFEAQVDNFTPSTHLFEFQHGTGTSKLIHEQVSVAVTL
jgi:hypothetical protein